MNLANSITMTRIGLIPLIMAAMLIPWQYGWLVAAILFFLAGLSDFLDGYVARKYDQGTTLGIFLDPLADKLLVSSVLICMVEMGQAPAWVVALIIGREFAVTGLRAVRAESGTVISASIWGKIKTVTQMMAIMLLLLGPLYESVTSWNIGLWVLYAATAATVLSGLEYFYRFTAFPPKPAKPAVKARKIKRRWRANPVSSSETP